MTTRAVRIRTFAVLGLGLAVLAAVLYYASTVDGRAPTVLEVSLTQHLAGDAEVALTTSSIEVDFSEPVVPASAETAFEITPRLKGTFTWSGTILTFTPAARLPLRTAFAVSIGAGVRDTAGNVMATSSSLFHFETVGNPSIVASNPVDAASEVALDAPITLQFSTLMDTGSVERALRLAPDLEVRLRWSGEQLTITPVTPLKPNRRYALVVGAQATDQAGTPLHAPFRLSFRTVPTSLAATSIVPADGVAGVAVTTAIAVVFDRGLDPESLRDDLLSITPPLAGSLEALAPPGAPGLSDSSLRILRFQPSGPLAPNTTYDVTLDPGLRAADGAALAAGMAWSFTTGAPTATLSNQVVFISPRAGIANLWAMNPDGTNQHQLSTELSPVVEYAIAPDGQAFVVGDGAVNVWQRADGSARRVLTEANVVEFDPAYSPDGSTIVFGRADPALATGLGLWMRDADGSDLRQIDLPAEVGASPSASPSGPLPLLRSPRISPDGTGLAFVDASGSVAILDLEEQRLGSAAFVALSEPIWLPDSSGVLVAGMPAGSGNEAPPYESRSPVLPLDPASGRPTVGAPTSLRVVSLHRDATSVLSTGLGAGAARASVDHSGWLSFIRFGSAGLSGGRLWVSAGPGDAGRDVVRDSGALVASASFAPEPDQMVISLVAPDGGGSSGTDGVWLLDLRSGETHRLSSDGWRPRWLP